MDSFGMQDEIFMLFRGSPELMSLLNITDTEDYDQLNTRIRREELEVKLLTADVLPFVSIVFVNAHPTENHLINKGVLELCIYTSTRNDALHIYRVAKGLLQNHYEDFRIVHEGQISSGVTGIYAYSIRFYPMINA